MAGRLGMMRQHKLAQDKGRRILYTQGKGAQVKTIRAGLDNLRRETHKERKLSDLKLEGEVTSK